MNSEDIAGSSLSVEIDVLANTQSDTMSTTNLLLIIILIIILSGGVGLTIFLRREGVLGSSITEKSIQTISPKEELEEASGIPCWICSSDVINGQAWACLECGARYHMEGQVQGCNIIEKGHCLHCDAAIDQLTEV